MLSVMANPNCRDKESAERAVNEVWESCFNDTRPFDEVCLAPCLACSPIFKSISRYINSVSGGTVSTPDLIKYFTTHIPLESALIGLILSMIILRNHMTATDVLNSSKRPLSVVCSILHLPHSHYSSSVMKRWPLVPI